MCCIPFDWWKPEEEGGFFGRNYKKGDNSQQGPFLYNCITLEQRTKREVAGVIRTLALTPGHLVIDVPCGYGRHSIRLAEHGIRVIGVDLNEYFLNVARESMKAKAIDPALLEFKKGDMRDLVECVPDSSADAVINMFTSFGFFNEEDNKRVLREANRMLKNGGKLLIHFDYNYHRIVSGRIKVDQPCQRDLEDNYKLVVVEDYDEVSKRINGYWWIGDGPESENFQRHYSLRVYSPEEITEALTSYGFSRTRVFGDFDFPERGLDFADQEMVVLAEK